MDAQDLAERPRDRSEDIGLSPSAAAPSAPEPAPKRQFGRSARAGAVAAVVLAAGGAYWIASPPTKESTDNAYTAADATSVAPRVRGLVAQVLVHDNQAVRAGAPLVRIDAEEFDAKVASARANLADAEADVASARAALRSLDADEALARASMAAARTDIRSASAQAQQAAADRRRYEALADSGSVSRHDAEVYRTAAVTAEQGAARAQALLAVSGSEASVTSARRPVLLAALQKAEAKRLQARAGLDLALQDQRHALIVAPIEGVVGNRRVRVGDYVEAGTRLLNVVPLQAIYVTANFKETQVRYMRVGQRAKVHVDALGQTLAGRVESLAPGSGSTFSLLPFEPGTGNFTKIVQRIPVRISLDPGQKGLADLRPGLSVTATVRFDADR